MRLNDLKKRLEKQMATGRPPEYNRATQELLLEAVDEIRAITERLDEMDRRARLARYGSCGCARDNTAQ